MVFRICFLCSGNICRSPTAEVVMRRLLEDAGLSDQVQVDSAGTGDWHVGGGADRRALAVMSQAGYDGSAHRARLFDQRWLAERDLVVALDRGHLAQLVAMAADDHQRSKVTLLRGHVPGGEGGDLDVPDPYYGALRDYELALTTIEQGCRGLLDDLVRDGVLRPA